ncbi:MULTISPECIES: hydrogenase maturation nickel metallochaperone HypA [Microtetraspora]|uniref:Hydrogenase maturation factor HypA n=1 Tax=Microtetraspora glauca TaxID=1996 RepID=A0ABV3GL69_MICGL|nr:hydrogenase maturation nickel metallochaperone HypA [Microtetraspora sp. AC03309]MCC5575826.1 hydrogenase maturation nickel metallochaperone HypA [Microtetraspora sp. AC03309]
MHEFGIAEAILDAVEKRAAGRPVQHARIRAGALLRITEPVINQAFAVVSAGSPAEGAHLELVIVPARHTCRTCRHVTTSDDVFATCAGCGGIDIETEGGDELILESIQTAEATHVPGNPRRDSGDPVGPS